MNNYNIKGLLDNPEYLVERLLLKHDIYYWMLLVKSCGGQDAVRTRYPELFV